jgi:hypothetical protein
MNRAMTRHIALVLGSAIAGCALAASPGQTDSGNPVLAPIFMNV